MLKGMQCVVVDEDADGALRRQVVRSVIEHLAKMLAAAGPDFGMGMGMRRHGGDFTQQAAAYVTLPSLREGVFVPSTVGPPTLG